MNLGLALFSNCVASRYVVITELKAEPLPQETLRHVNMLGVRLRIIARRKGFLREVAQEKELRTPCRIPSTLAIARDRQSRVSRECRDVSDHRNYRGACLRPERSMRANMQETRRTSRNVHIRLRLAVGLRRDRSFPCTQIRALSRRLRPRRQIVARRSPTLCVRTR